MNTPFCFSKKAWIEINIGQLYFCIVHVNESKKIIFCLLFHLFFSKIQKKRFFVKMKNTFVKNWSNWFCRDFDRQREGNTQIKNSGGFVKAWFYNNFFEIKFKSIGIMNVSPAFLRVRVDTRWNASNMEKKVEKSLQKWRNIFQFFL